MDRVLLTRGRTVQVFTKTEGGLLLVMPGFMRRILASWDGQWLGRR
jgi:hypothetical protein